MRRLLPARAIALGLSLALATALPALPLDAHADTPAGRQDVGNRISENVPEIPAALVERLAQYQNTRGAAFSGWLGDGSMLIGTRFGETAQVHRVRAPLGMREQLTFFREPINTVRVRPTRAGNGFVFARDEGGNEFWQLYYYDLDTRAITLLTDGGRSRNEQPLWSHDGRQLAYTSTSRNGTDSDIWVRTLDGEPRLVRSEGGAWYANDFSPDGTKLLVTRYVSINETIPGEVDLATGALTLFPVDGERASVAAFRYAPDGRSAYFISNEGTEFRTLRRHNAAMGATAESISGDIPWDVTGYTIADDGRHLAFITNEDGISKLHVRRLPDHAPVEVPALPIGVIGGVEFSPDGQRLALTLNSATSPSDVHVIDLAAGDAGTPVAWTASEVGGLDASRFVAPTLVRYPTFDEVDGAPRTIPAFYYRPTRPSPNANGRYPVVIQIHGGPEAQSFPTFNPSIQYMLDEMGVAVLVPNVRGSAGYGKTYLDLDNGMLRKDSVKDIGALLDWIATQPELDADRVAVFGGSYGGYMVLASMVDYNERIAAGIDIVGISDFVTFLRNTESYRRDLRRAEYGDERDPAMLAFLQEIAPLRNASAITRPLFVAQGLNDPRVPASEAEQIFEAVQANGGEPWFLMFKDEGHGFAKKSNADYFGAATMLFWQRHLLDAPAAPAAE